MSEQLKYLSGAGGTANHLPVTSESPQDDDGRRATWTSALAQRQPGERRVQHGLQVHGVWCGDATHRLLLFVGLHRALLVLPGAMRRFSKRQPEAYAMRQVTQLSYAWLALFQLPCVRSVKIEERVDWTEAVKRIVVGELRIELPKRNHASFHKACRGW